MNPTIYKQYDSRWGKLPYPSSGSNLSNSGCGCLSVFHCAIELDKYKNLTVPDCRKYMVQFATVANGTLWAGITKGLEHYGYKVHWREADSMADIYAQLKSSLKRGVILFAKKNGTAKGPDGTVWTTDGHFCAFTDYKIEGGKHWFYIKDSGSRDHDGWYAYETSMKGCIRNLWVCKSADSKPAPTPKPSGKIKVDGVGGAETVMALQKFLGTTQDGVISGQNASLSKYYNALQAVSFDGGGSSCIKKLQSWLGLSGPDGIIGQNTTKALQKRLRDYGYLASNEIIDGYFGPKSMKALQEFLNNDGKRKSVPDTKPATETKVSGATKDYLVVDVSYCQSDIDWNKAKKDGVKGAIVRCGFRGYETGKLQEDSMFLKHIKGAKKAGLYVGVYFFTEGINASEGREEANYTLSLIKKAGVALDYPIAIDTEAQSAKNERAKNLSKARRTEVIKAFCEQIKAKGYEPMIYASTSWLNNKLDMKKLPYKVWCAQYYSKCEYTGKYVMWQYTSTGKINGIKGNVDLNHCYITPKETTSPKESAPKPTEKKGYTGKIPSYRLTKTNAQIMADTVKWAKWIAGNNDFHYGHGAHAHHNGCYFCGTQPKSKKTSGIKMWETTYCCNPFVTAAQAHGGGIATQFKLCANGKSWIESNYRASTQYDNLGKPDKSKLKAGDVLCCKNGHVMLYIGDGKLAEAANGDDNKPYSKSWNESIHVSSLSSDRWNNKSYGVSVVFRYKGNVDCDRVISHGEVSDRVTDLQKFLDWYFDGKVGSADGCFGDNTLKWVKQFQEKELGKGQGNGIVGQKTIEAMKAVKK